MSSGSGIGGNRKLRHLRVARVALVGVVPAWLRSEIRCRAGGRRRRENEVHVGLRSGVGGVMFGRDGNGGNRRASPGFYSKGRVSRAQPWYASPKNENGRVYCRSFQMSVVSRRTFYPISHQVRTAAADKRRSLRGCAKDPQVSPFAESRRARQRRSLCLPCTFSIHAEPRISYAHPRYTNQASWSS